MFFLCKKLHEREMPMETLRRIILDGRTFPVKIDLNVLEKIQDEYGSIYEFERKILGLEVARDRNGKVIYGDDKKPVMLSVEPSIKAIKTVLPLMINEGLAIEAGETGQSWEPVSDLWVFANCSIDFNVLAKMIHAEFKRCFETKK